MAYNYDVDIYNPFKYYNNFNFDHSQTHPPTCSSASSPESEPPLDALPRSVADEDMSPDGKVWLALTSMIQEQESEAYLDTIRLNTLVGEPRIPAECGYDADCELDDGDDIDILSIPDTEDSDIDLADSSGSIVHHNTNTESTNDAASVTSDFSLYSQSDFDAYDPDPDRLLVSNWDFHNAMHNRRSRGPPPTDAISPLDTTHYLGLVPAETDIHDANGKLIGTQTHHDRIKSPVFSANKKRSRDDEDEDEDGGEKPVAKQFCQKMLGFFKRHF